MSNISSLCYNPTPQNGTTTEVHFPIADAEIRKAIYTDSLRTYIGLPATPTISIDSSSNINRLSFWPMNNYTQMPLILQGNDSPIIPNDSTIKIINRENTEYNHYLVNNSGYEDSLSEYLYFWELSSSKNLCLGASRKINGTWFGNEIVLSINANGTKSVTLTDPAAWREAFGIKDLGLVETVPGDTKSISSGKITNLCGKSFSAGTWLIHCTANFPAGNNLRNIYLSTSTTGSGDSIFSGAYERSNSAGTSIINFTTIKTFTSSTGRYLNVYQNSGSVQSVYGGMKAVKICDFVA